MYIVSNIILQQFYHKKQTKCDHLCDTTMEFIDGFLKLHVAESLHSLQTLKLF